MEIVREIVYDEEIKKKLYSLLGIQGVAKFC